MRVSMLASEPTSEIFAAESPAPIPTAASARERIRQFVESENSLRQRGDDALPDESATAQFSHLRFNSLACTKKTDASHTGAKLFARRLNS
jgi:hypothetical protein